MSRLEVLASLPRNGVGVEVGVWTGIFSGRLLSHTAPRRLYLVDPWVFDPSRPSAWYGGKIAESQRDMDLIHDGVKAWAEVSDRRVVRVMRMTSAAAIKYFIAQRLKLDWAYIDGDHTYDAVKADLEGFKRLIKRGGVLAGDDYGNSGWWGDGVVRAVDEVLPGAEVYGTQFIWRNE